MVMIVKTQIVRILMIAMIVVKIMVVVEIFISIIP